MFLSYALSGIIVPAIILLVIKTLSSASVFFVLKRKRNNIPTEEDSFISRLKNHHENNCVSSMECTDGDVLDSYRHSRGRRLIRR